MNSHPLEVRVVLLALKAFSRVLLVLGSDISGYTWYTALSLLGALEDDLHPVTFCFLCHSDDN